jgi:hypothetical protein
MLKILKKNGKSAKQTQNTPLHSQNAVKMGVFGVKMMTSIDFGTEKV